MFTMKRIRMLQDFGLWGKKGKTYDASDEFAQRILKERVDVTDDFKIVYRPSPLAVLVKDLGRHIGMSRHIYLKDGRSEACQ